MSKTKASGATHYEILFILPNKFTDDEAKGMCEKVGQMIAENGGTVTYNEYWGKKKLAYDIKHNAYGYYGLLEFDLEGQALAKLEKALRLSADVLRHQVVVKKTKSEAEIEKAKAIRAKIESKKAAEEKVQADKEKAAAPAPAKTKEKSDNRAELKDLDEKLEGILNAKDLL